MKKILKWTGIVAAGLVGLALIGVAYLYVASERELNRHYEVAAPAIAVPTDPAEIAEGRRLAQLTGCTHCHTETLGGTVVMDIDKVVRFVAPNLTAVLPNYNDGELMNAMRKGVKQDGTSVLFMPSEMLAHLNDQDVARIIAWIRTVPATAGETRTNEVRPVGRYIIATGKYVPPARAIANAAPGHAPANLGPAAARGRYLVMSTCTECHGQDLHGIPFAKSPPLIVAKGYPLEDFSKLLHEGIALGGRELGLMSKAARTRFVALTPEETRQIHEFLQTL